MQFDYAILTFLPFVSLIIASGTTEHGLSLEISHVSKSESSEQVKPKRQKPPGYHGKEQRKGRKIVELLKTKGNGISKYKDAEPLAEKIYKNQLRNRNEKDRQIRSGERQKGKAPGSGISPSTLPPGYKNKEATLNRAVMRFMRNHPDIAETEAKQMADKEYELKKNEKNRKWREKNRLKRQEEPNKPPIRPRTSHGQKTWEAIKQRRIDTLLRQQDKNGVSSCEEAEKLADQYIQEEKRKNAELKRKKRALKKQEKIEASSANSAP